MDRSARTHPNRAIALLVLAVLTGFSATASAAETDRSLRGDFTPERIADHVYVIHGPNEFPNPKNQGFFNNPVIVLTSKGVVVIDPGSTVYAGQRVVAQAQKLSNQPIVAVFNTHHHGDHWMGNDGIVRAYPKVAIYGHPAMKAQIESGAGEAWLYTINQLADGAATGTRLVAPNTVVRHGQVIALGDTEFKIHHHRTAHTNNDIMVEIVKAGVLVAGDTVRARNLSPIVADFTGNIGLIDTILATRARVIVPGHGQTGGQDVALAFRGFLVKLKARVKLYYDKGLADFQMKQQVMDDLAEYKDWVGFDDHIGRLIHTAFAEVERESFN